MKEHREYANLKRSVFEFNEKEVTQALVESIGDDRPENDYDGRWELEFIHPSMNDWDGYIMRLKWTKHSGFTKDDRSTV